MADGALLTFHKVDGALPDVLLPDAMYFVRKAPGIMSVVVTSAAGIPHQMDFPRQALHFQFGSIAKPPADGVFGRYLVAEPLDLEGSLSQVIAAAPAATDAVIRVLRGTDLVARWTILAGTSAAIAEILIPTIDSGEVLEFRGPIVQDATLSGLDGTLVGFRRVG